MNRRERKDSTHKGGCDRPAGPRFRYLEPQDKKAYLQEIGRLLDLDREPALHAALFFTLRFLKLARARALDPKTCLNELLSEKPRPAPATEAPRWEQALEAIQTRLATLESSASSSVLPQQARRLPTARIQRPEQLEAQTVTPITVVAASSDTQLKTATQPLEQLISKVDGAAPARADYRSCRPTHRTLQF